MTRKDNVRQGDRPLRIAVVGPCAAGKSTLAEALRAAGYDARQPAQEHSYVPNMWERMTRPDLLIYLDIDGQSIKQRCPHLDAIPQRLAEQQQRLAHARQNSDFYLDTSGLTILDVRQQVLAYVREVDNGAD